MKSQELKEYAPVLIPTLNRYSHLKNLLYSLSGCNLADKTEVYVAVDYPSKESHWEGYNQIISFLNSIGDLGFKKLHIIKREKNLGIGKNGNFDILIKNLLNKYDRFIFTEDDNIFSVHFLEFINYNLEKYKDDPSIFSVCGYMYPIKEPFNYFARAELNYYSAWGTGFWSNKYIDFITFEENKKNLHILINDKKNKNLIIKKRKALYNGLIGMYKSDNILGDLLISAYLVVNKMKNIFPSQSLVQNKGWDGSGSHGGVNKIYLNQPLYNGCVDLKSLLSDQDNKLLETKVDNYFKRQPATIQKILTFLTFYIYRFTGKYINFNFLRKTWKKYIRNLKIR